MATMMGRLEDSDMDQLEQWLGTGPKTFTLLFSATRDGCSTATFHQKCDNKGPTVTVLYNPQGSVYGGYTGQSWEASTNGKYINDSTAFLYQLKFSGNEQRTKFPIVDSNNAIYSYNGHGPNFGDSALFRTFKNSIAPLNGVYALNGSTKLNDGSYRVSNVSPKVKSWNDINNGNLDVTELEVYKVTDGARVTRGTDAVWRKTAAIDAKTLGQLKEEVENLKPPSDSVDNFRLLLVGPVGSGKSSFINTVASVFRGRITQRAMVGKSTHTVTTAYTPITVRGSKDSNLHFLLCDTPGIADNTWLAPTEADFLLGGHVPDFYQFHPMAPLSAEDPKFVVKPRPADKIHCVVFVLDSSEEIQPAMMVRLKAVQTICIQKDIPQLVILTKVDRRDKGVQENVKSVYRSKPIQEIVEKMADSFGIPEYLVYPVKGYTKELTLDTGVDILALMALKQMLFCAEDHLDNAQMRGAMSAMRLGGADHENASESV